ncbi:unnamed protein product [Blepharisma stoltei]|uniref:Uncharacterized protein n=1 Tax=Blepharisma stoltei TaxID=1481888 RepID=A0AAU9IYR0_9CILI|nr:unnamed protein product [Blepharisma stoltei]
MLRQLPYRFHPSTKTHSLIQKALNSTFYLVQELGPTSFLLKDDNKISYRVSIGSTVQCSCRKTSPDHCIHTLYVLLKIFKLNPYNPLLWQLSFIDSEINWILNNRQCISFDSIEETWSKAKEISKRVKLNTECCSICQEEMKSADDLVYCKNGCGHNFHIKCMKIWADHKISNDEIVTCPMCRAEWKLATLQKPDPLPISELKQKIKHNPDSWCEGCGKCPIRNEKFKCLACPEIYLCLRCFYIEHIDHPMLRKRSYKHRWEPAFRPGEKECDLETYIMKAVPSAEGWECIICKDRAECDWKIFLCGHTAHECCLIINLRNHQYLCPEDDSLILSGLDIEYYKPKKNRENCSVRNNKRNRGDSVPTTRKIFRNPPTTWNRSRRIDESFQLPSLIITKFERDLNALNLSSLI